MNWEHRFMPRFIVVALLVLVGLAPVLVFGLLDAIF